MQGVKFGWGGQWNNLYKKYILILSESVDMVLKIQTVINQISRYL